MTQSDPLWVQVSDALHFIDNVEAIAQIADRFEAAYAPVIATAETDAARQKAIDALGYYLASGATPHKHWALKRDVAERAQAALVELALRVV